MVPHDSEWRNYFDDKWLDFYIVSLEHSKKRFWINICAIYVQSVFKPCCIDYR